MKITVKTIVSALLALVFAFSLLPVAALADGEPTDVVAKPSSQKVQVNGEIIAFDAYNIEGSNYFKLRDLALVLSGTRVQFEIGWDGENNAITLTPDMPYTPNGSELMPKGSEEKTAKPSTAKIYCEDYPLSFEGYNIDGNNYYKLRDVGIYFDFKVDYDEAERMIVVDTDQPYSPGLTSKYYLTVEPLTTSEPDYINIYWAQVTIHSLEPVFLPDAVTGATATVNGESDVIYIDRYFGAYYDEPDYIANADEYKQMRIAEQGPNAFGEYIYTLMIVQNDGSDVVKSFETGPGTGAMGLYPGKYVFTVDFCGETLTYELEF